MDVISCPRGPRKGHAENVITSRHVAWFDPFGTLRGSYNSIHVIIFAFGMQSPRVYSLAHTHAMGWHNMCCFCHGCIDKQNLTNKTPT